MICKKHEYIDKLIDGTKGNYLTSITYGGGWICTCPDFMFRRRVCKHISKLMEEIMSNNLDEILSNKTIGKEFKSSLNNLNSLFESPLYNSNQIVTLYGKPGSGKTLLAIQDAIFLLTKGFNILFIDTEGSLIPMLRKWVPVLEKRFGKRKGNMIIEKKKTLETLMEYLGYEVDLEYKMKDKKKKKGKLEFKILQTIKSKAEEVIKSNHIDFVILDSLTSPLRSFTTEQQNFPARSNATAFILRELTRLQEDFDIGVLVTNHASYNPQNIYETKAELTGGIIVQYYSKRILYLDKRSSKESRDIRRFWLVRGEGSPKWSKAVPSKINDTGYHDVDNVEQIAFTLTELSNLGIKP